MQDFEHLSIRDMIPPNKEIAPTILQGETVGEVASFFKREGVEEAFVLNEKCHVVGLITLKSLFHELSEGRLDRPISEVTEETFPSLRFSDPLAKALDYFLVGSKTIAVLKEDDSFYQALEIDDVRSLLQEELEFLSADLDRLPLEILNPRALLKILKGISDNSNIRVLVTDEKGILRFFNRAYEELAGISRREAIGKHVTEIFPQSRIPHVLKAGKPEVRYYRSAFEARYVVSRRIPLKNGKRIFGVLSFTLFRDISDMEDLLQRFSLLQNRVEYYRKELESVRLSKYRIEHIVGKSPKILQVKDLINKYAQGDSTVLIVGESGTGKELVANAIHQASKRKNLPLIVVNCASIPKDLLESELFGYESGSFTGANQKGKPGKFELAHKGTIFLDEVGDLPIDMQGKLLRVLQEREIERIGGRRPIPIDFRLIAATNKNLNALVREGSFRGDFYYRLAVLTLSVPSLKERKEDLPLLTQYILGRLNLKLGKAIQNVDDEVAGIFNRYDWPGNIRELENILEYAVNNTSSDLISVNSLPLVLNTSQSYSNFKIPIEKVPLPQQIEAFEKSVLVDALNNAKGNRVDAALILGISKSGLYKLLKKYKIE